MDEAATKIKARRNATDEFHGAIIVVSVSWLAATKLSQTAQCREKRLQNYFETGEVSAAV